MGVKNWCYGAKEPDLTTAVQEAVYRAHQYRNKLCELELQKRERHDELLRRLVPDYTALLQQCEQLSQQIEDLLGQIQAERVKQRTKTPTGVQSLAEQVKQLKAERKERWRQCTAAKKAAYQTAAVKAAMDANQEQFNREVKAAKQESGLYWGTEAVVRESCGSFNRGAPPEFRRFSGEGQLGVQLQGGVDTADMFNKNTLCYLAPGEGKYSDCWFRIGSDNRRPIFAKIPVILHRPLPAGRVKWAYLERRRLADQVKYKLRLSIDITAPPPPFVDGEVAVHTGWRTEDNGLRVATWLGSDGRQGVLRLPNWHCQDYVKLDLVASQRKTRFNNALQLLRDWLKDAEVEVPEWFAEATTHLHAWRSQQRLASLVYRWRDERFEADEEIFEQLNEWRKYDKHRWQHASRLFLRIKNRRKDLYRCFVKDLRKHYGVVYLAKLPAEKLARRSEVEELAYDNTQANRNAKIAAISQLGQFLGESFPQRVIEVGVVNLTRQCASCGHINRRSDSWKVQCLGCGETYDIDDNAVSNTFTRGEVAHADGALEELARKAAEKQRKAEERLAKLITGRQEAGRKQQAAKDKKRKPA